MTNKLILTFFFIFSSFITIYPTKKENITLFGTNKMKGALVNKIIDQYKTSKKLFLITFVPNQIYCLAGYWIEKTNPGSFKSIFYERSQEKINEYKDIKKEIQKSILILFLRIY